jgi:hypothetical protein
MKKELMNLFLFIGICFVLYLLFRNFNFNTKEGLTTQTTQTAPNSNSTNGVAGNAASYAALIKATTIKMQDEFLISKYRTDYETTILNLDDLINSLMLKTALSVDANNPDKLIIKLSQLNEAKNALNNVMKFVDSSK